MIQSNHLTVTDKKKTVCESNGRGMRVTIQNPSSNSIYLGGPNLTVKNGFELKKNESLGLIMAPAESLYAVTEKDEKADIQILMQGAVS